MVDWYAGYDTHFWMALESTQNTAITDGTQFRRIPHGGLDWNANQQEPRTPELNAGGHKRKYQLAHRRSHMLTLPTELLRDTAYILMHCWLDRSGDNNQAPPFTALRYDPHRYERIAGCMITSGEVNVDFNSGAAVWTFEAQGMSFAESDNDSLAPQLSVPTYPDEVPFQCSQAVVSLFESAEDEVETLTLRSENTVQVSRPDSDGNPVWLVVTKREVSGSIRLRHKDNTYRDKLISPTKGEVELQFTHPEGGSNAVLTMTTPEGLFTQAKPDPALEEVARADIEFQAEMDSNDDDITWSLA